MNNTLSRSFAMMQLARPVRISVKKRVSWRLYIKWFNRYIKDGMIGTIVKIGETPEGESLDVITTNVKIEKAGGHKRTLIVESEPIF